jgi:YHS domain-containing protein
MTRHLIVFIVTFAIGAVIAVILRTGSHKPYEDHSGHPAPSAASAAPATAYDAANPQAGTASSAPAGDAHQGHNAPAALTPAAGEHAGMPMAAPAAPRQPVPAAEHAGHNQAGPAPATTAVNTICAICGMPVDPRLGIIEYKGKLIGFGCKTCPPKFKADPEKYGEAALKNQVVE